MCLSPREQRVLRQTGLSLRDTDPRLAGMLSVFARVAAHEEMPPTESLRGPAVRGGLPRHSARMALQLLAVVVVVTAVVVPLIATHGASRSLPGRQASCTTAWTWTRQASTASCPDASVRKTRPSPASQVPQAGP